MSAPSLYNFAPMAQVVFTLSVVIMGTVPVPPLLGHQDALAC